MGRFAREANEYSVPMEDASVMKRVSSKCSEGRRWHAMVDGTVTGVRDPPFPPVGCAGGWEKPEPLKLPYVVGIVAEPEVDRGYA